MESTLKMFKTINNSQLNIYTYEELSELYKLTRNPQIIANAFIRLYDLIYVDGAKFFFIDDSDLSSISVKKLNDCLLSYDNSSNASFVYYFNKGLLQELFTESKSRSYDKRRINYDIHLQISLEAINDDTTMESHRSDKITFSVAENPYNILKMAIDDYKQLTDRERRLCLYILENASEVTKDELAKVLGITRPTVYKTLESLKTKLKPLLAN